MGTLPKFGCGAMPGAHSFRRHKAACLCVIPRHPRPSLPLPVTELLPEMREHSWVTSLGMHRGLHGGSDGAEIRCHWEQLDGLFHHLPQSQSGPTQSEGSAQMSEEIISGGTYPTAHRPPPPHCGPSSVWLWGSCSQEAAKNRVREHHTLSQTPLPHQLCS